MLEPFSIAEEDIVAEMTERRAHIKLYDEFIEQWGERPTQEEYDEVVEIYKDKLRATGRHPRVEDIVSGNESKVSSKTDAPFWVFYVLLVLAVLGSISVAFFVMWRKV